MFGRIAPEQKEQIVASLIRQGNYVAMMGDGVNDALAQEGQAWHRHGERQQRDVTRHVTDMILLNDSFAALLPALTEGKRIVGGLMANYFGLVMPGPQGPELKVMVIALPLWFLSLRTIWRAKLFDRLLTGGDSSKAR